MNSYNQGEVFEKWQAELETRMFLWEKRLKLVKSYCLSGSMLDVGTGDGFFLNIAKRHFEVDATEISSTGVDYAKSFGHQVHQGTVFDPEFDDRKFDVITIWHVLEHVEHPGRFLKRIRKLLAHDGVLFVAVPNELRALCLPRAILKRENPFAEMRQGEELHLTHFTPASLKKYMEQFHGLRMLDLKVDDVYLHRSRLVSANLFVNSLLNRVFKTHLVDAMIAVFRR